MLTIVLALVLAVVLLLAIPLTMAFDVCWRREFEGYVAFRWAFGLVRVRIPLPRTAPTTEEAGVPERGHDRAERKRGPAMFAAARRPDFRGRLLRFVSDIWRALRKEEVRVSLRLGLGDPADTGRLWAVVGPLSGMLANRRDADLRVEPDFLDAALEFEGSGAIRLVPLQLVGITIGLALSPAFWRGVGTMRAPG